jgi:hypothetical protein
MTPPPTDVWWSIFVILVSAAGLSIAYWYTEKTFLPYWRSTLSILGLEVIRRYGDPYFATIDYAWAIWILFTAIYFKITLPLELRLWTSFFLAFVQSFIVYLLGLAVLFLGVVTSPPPSVVPSERRLGLIPGASITSPIGRDINPVRPHELSIPITAREVASGRADIREAIAETSHAQEIRLQRVPRAPQGNTTPIQPEPAQELPQALRSSALRGQGQVIQVGP